MPQSSRARPILTRMSGSPEDSMNQPTRISTTSVKIALKQSPHCLAAASRIPSRPSRTASLVVSSNLALASSSSLTTPSLLPPPCSKLSCSAVRKTSCSAVLSAVSSCWVHQPTQPGKCGCSEPTRPSAFPHNWRTCRPAWPPLTASSTESWISSLERDT